MKKKPKHAGGRPAVARTAVSRWMVRHKLTNEAVAAALGCHPNTVNRIRHGKKPLPVFAGMLRRMGCPI